MPMIPPDLQNVGEFFVLFVYLSSQTHFDGSFAYDGPRLWNSLSVALQSSPTLSSFRREPKARLFHEAYPP